MHARLAQQAARAGRRIVTQIPNGLHLDNEKFGPPPTDFLHPDAYSVEQPDYRSVVILFCFFLYVFSLLFPIFHLLSLSFSFFLHFSSISFNMNGAGEVITGKTYNHCSHLCLYRYK
jgi:hypothetical protein